MAAAAQAQAEALEFLAEFEEIDHTLFLCGFANPIHRFGLIDGEGLDTLDSFGDIPDETFDHTARTWESKGERNRIAFGIGRLQKLKAVAFWSASVSVKGLRSTLRIWMRPHRTYAKGESDDRERGKG
jgi:hypothetical protein